MLRTCARQALGNVVADQLAESGRALDVGLRALRGNEARCTARGVVGIPSGIPSAR